MKPKRITGADMIRRARAAQAERAGVRVAVRFPDALIARARLCAADVDDTLADWVNAACRQWRKGVFDGVARAEKTELATRKESESITVRAPAGMPAADIKTAVIAACAWCEERRITYHPDPPPRYILEK